MKVTYDDAVLGAALGAVLARALCRLRGQTPQNDTKDKLVRAKAVFNEPSFEAFLTERLGAYSDEGFVTDTFTTKDMVGIGRDCAKWKDSQAHLKEIQVSKFTHGQPSNDFPFGEYEEFIKKEFQDYNQSCAACAKWGWGEAQNEIQILREQLMQADEIAELSAAYAQLNEEYDVLSKDRDRLQKQFEKETLETWNRGEEIRRLRETVQSIASGAYCSSCSCNCHLVALEALASRSPKGDGV